MDTTRPATDEQLYDTDFYGWTQRQADHIREGRFSSVDLANVAEEIESSGRAQLSALTSSYRLIAMHLLKVMRQPHRATASWSRTISRERGNIELLLDENSGLKSKREALLLKAYAVARRDAASETKLPLADFPDEPPFGVADVESRTFRPGRRTVSASG